MEWLRLFFRAAIPVPTRHIGLLLGCLMAGACASSAAHDAHLPPPPPIPPSIVLRPPPIFVVFFDFGSATLTEGRRTVIAHAVAKVTSGGIVDVIVGHADTVGSRESNRALSLRRAEAVKTEMVRMGLNPATLRVEASGFDEPMVQTAPNVREEANRRVVIIFEETKR